MKRKILSALAVVLFMSSSLNANSNIENKTSFLEMDYCVAHATAVALQAPSYGVSYWEAWFFSYDWCLSN